jgi:hypothetical protein
LRQIALVAAHIVAALANVAANTCVFHCLSPLCLQYAQIWG